LQGVAAAVLSYRLEAGHTVTLFVLAAHQAARPLWRDQDDVQVRARLDLLVVNIEAVGEQDGRALVQVVDDRGIQLRLRQVRCQKRDDRSAFCGLRWFLYFEPVRFGTSCPLSLRLSACARPWLP
jgi:hypothetical protein